MFYDFRGMNSIELLNQLERDFKNIKEKEKITLDPKVFIPLYSTLVNSGVEINKYLRKIDLSKIDFYNLSVIGVDFSGTNAKINPQMVLLKSLYKTNLEGMDLSSYSFEDVDIRYANLKNTNANIVLRKLKRLSVAGANLVGTNIDFDDIKYIDIEKTIFDEKDTLKVKKLIK